MPIILFQAMIIASMMITRFVAKEKLGWVAGGWSVFTLIMVFMPWLMIIQLIVIWGTYAILATKNARLENQKQDK